MLTWIFLPGFGQGGVEGAAEAISDISDILTEPFIQVLLRF
jgi:hypothetical protein